MMFKITRRDLVFKSVVRLRRNLWISLFQDWVYRNLEKFRNCSVNPNVLNEHSKNEIKRDLLYHGFKNSKVKHFTRDIDGGKAFSKDLREPKIQHVEFCILDVE